MSSVFTQDSDSGIRMHAFIDGPLPWSEVVCFDGCTGGTYPITRYEATYAGRYARLTTGEAR